MEKQRCSIITIWREGGEGRRREEHVGRPGGIHDA
jgi:hypothetical protein